MKTFEWGQTASKKMNWFESQNWIEDLNKNEYLGYSDWRLPERWELVKAYDDKVEGFKSDYYWSSTTDVYYADLGVIVYFFNGFVGSFNKSNYYYVRPVRGEQCIGNLKIKKSDIKREAVKLLKGMIGRLK